MTDLATDPLADLVLSEILDRVAELVKEDEAGLLLPWQQEELAIVCELLRSIHQSRRLRLQ
jgi:hypothetical protein